MQKSGGLIALLLVLAIILMPFGNSPENGQGAVFPQAVCGNTAVQSTVPHEDNGNDTTEIIAVVVIVIIVIFIIHCITDTENQHTVRR